MMMLILTVLAMLTMLTMLTRLKRNLSSTRKRYQRKTSTVSIMFFQEAVEKDLGAQKSILKKSQGKKTTTTLKNLWTVGAAVAGLCFLFSNSFIG